MPAQVLLFPLPASPGEDEHPLHALRVSALLFFIARHLQGYLQNYPANRPPPPRTFHYCMVRARRVLEQENGNAAEALHAAIGSPYF